MRHQLQHDLFNYTIYGDNAVGITFKPATNLTLQELRNLIMDLQDVANEMRSPISRRITNE